jgi:hypothetical protein
MCAAGSARSSSQNETLASTKQQAIESTLQRLTNPAFHILQFKKVKMRPYSSCSSFVLLLREVFVQYQVIQKF